MLQLIIKKEADVVSKDNERKYDKYFLQDIILPDVIAGPESKQRYNDMGRRRILWLDSSNMAGADFQLNSAWIIHASGEQDSIKGVVVKDVTRGVEHSHDKNELLSFIGSNPDEPSDLCGEVEFYVEGEKYLLTKSTYIYMPAGLKHSLPYMIRVDRPIFHFSIIFGSNYHMNLADGTVFKVE